MVFETNACSGPGVLVLVLSWAITLFTLWQMVEMHEMVEGRRFDRYHELAQHAFGPKLGLYILIPQQLIIEVGVNIVYMVTGGQSLMRFCDLVTHDNCAIKDQRLWITIFASSQFVLAQLPSFNSIIGVSLAAAVMSLRYVCACAFLRHA
jgi:amino acid permease